MGWLDETWKSVYRPIEQTVDQISHNPLPVLVSIGAISLGLPPWQAGALGGATGAATTGGDIVKGALTGGALAYVGNAAGLSAAENIQLSNEIAQSAAVGAVSGGATAALSAAINGGKIDSSIWNGLVVGATIGGARQIMTREEAINSVPKNVLEKAYNINASGGNGMQSFFDEMGWSDIGGAKLAAEQAIGDYGYNKPVYDQARSLGFSDQEVDSIMSSGNIDNLKDAVKNADLHNRAISSGISEEDYQTILKNTGEPTGPVSPEEIAKANQNSDDPLGELIKIKGWSLNQQAIAAAKGALDSVKPVNPEDTRQQEEQRLQQQNENRRIQDVEQQKFQQQQAQDQIEQQKFLEQQARDQQQNELIRQENQRQMDLAAKQNEIVRPESQIPTKDSNGNLAYYDTKDGNVYTPEGKLIENLWHPGPPVQQATNQPVIPETQPSWKISGVKELGNGLYSSEYPPTKVPEGQTLASQTDIDNGRANLVENDDGSYTYVKSPTVEQAPVEKPSIPVIVPPVMEPPVVNKPVEPVVEQPPITTPVIPPPVVEQPPITTPVVSQPPVVEQPPITTPVIPPPVTIPTEIPELIDNKPYVPSEIPELIDNKPPVTPEVPFVPPAVIPPAEPTLPPETRGHYTWGTPPKVNIPTGLNPGLITDVPSFYQTTNPAQSQYYWGQHPYQPGKTFDKTLYNQIPKAPVSPFGLGYAQTAATPEEILQQMQGVYPLMGTTNINGPVKP